MSYVHGTKPSMPMTFYQRCLYPVAYPWLALMFGPVKPGVALICWVGWLVALSMTSQQILLWGTVAPIASMLISITASVLLLLDRAAQRAKAREATGSASTD